jgi:hypothetical protein
MSQHLQQRFLAITFRDAQDRVLIHVNRQGGLVDHHDEARAAKYYEYVAGYGMPGDGVTSPVVRAGSLQHFVQFDPRVHETTPAEMAHLFGGEMPLIEPVGTCVPVPPFDLTVWGAPLAHPQALAFHEAGRTLAPALNVS